MGSAKPRQRLVQRWHPATGDRPPPSSRSPGSSAPVLRAVHFLDLGQIELSVPARPGRLPGRRPCRTSHSPRPATPPAAVGPRETPAAPGPGSAPETPVSAGRPHQDSGRLVDRLCDRLGGRAADHRRPSPADHRAPVSRRESARLRRRPPRPRSSASPTARAVANTKRGADAFAAAEHAVTHCFVQSRRARDRFGQPRSEGALHAPLPRLELFAESVRMRRAQMRFVTELRGAAHARLSNTSGSNSIIACWKAVPQARGSSA